MEKVEWKKAVKIDNLIIKEFGKGTLLNLGDGNSVMVPTSCIKNDDGENRDGSYDATREGTKYIVLKPDFTFKVNHSVFDQEARRYKVVFTSEIVGDILIEMIRKARDVAKKPE